MFVNFGVLSLNSVLGIKSLFFYFSVFGVFISFSLLLAFKLNTRKAQRLYYIAQEERRIMMHKYIRTEWIIFNKIS